jgi:hypothetical protein
MAVQMNPAQYLPLVAEAKSWPDGIDSAAILWYLAIALGVPALGYVCMVLDFRAYLRSLRRALVVVAGYRTELPEWMRKNTPRCIIALGLVMPCTTEDVLAAYRRRVKELHPDHGGDRREFLRLQAHFEEAMEFVAGK